MSEKMITCLWFDHGKRGKQPNLCRDPPGRPGGKITPPPTDRPAGPEGRETIIYFGVWGRQFMGPKGGRKSLPKERAGFLSPPGSRAGAGRRGKAWERKGGRERGGGGGRGGGGFYWRISPPPLLGATTDPDARSQTRDECNDDHGENRHRRDEAARAKQ